MRYTIVKHDMLEKLCSHVNALLAEGWELQGGVAAVDVRQASREMFTAVVTSVTSERHYAQAMIHPKLAPVATLSDCPTCAGTGQATPAG